MKMDVYIPISVLSGNENVCRYTDAVQLVRCEPIMSYHTTVVARKRYFTDVDWCWSWSNM